jgi:hypothetical protein
MKSHRTQQTMTMIMEEMAVAKIEAEQAVLMTMVKMEKNWQAEKMLIEEMKDNLMQNKTIQISLTIA